MRLILQGREPNCYICRSKNQLMKKKINSGRKNKRKEKIMRQEKTTKFSSKDTIFLGALGKESEILLQLVLKIDE